MRQIQSILFFLMSGLTLVAAAEEGGTGSVAVILFMFFGLAVGIFSMQILSYLGDPVPYTCVVFLLGILFSLASHGNGVFGESIDQWINIDPELLLFVFLPPLIFGEAMSLNWYHVKGAFWQAVILAGPGVIIGAALTGVIAKYMLPYSWNWNLSMTFGSILSATDPVAVVSLLKSVGASPKLTMIIVGESLLNDGTAMVLFTVFNHCLNGMSYTIDSIIVFFASACFGSAFIGLLIGAVTVRWMRTANRTLSEMDVLVQIAITLCAAYLTFFVTQGTLGISGVLGCCGAGIMLAWLAPPIILSHETMHHVWGMIEWVFNTLIFLLAGLIIGNRGFEEVNPVDWFLVVVLYVLLMIVRAIVIAVLYPFVSRIGHKCTINEAVFMFWGGLRGALGMTLALIVYRTGPEDLKSETSRMFFYIGGIAALTLVFNATTAKSMLFRLQLLGGDSAEKSLVMTQIKRKLRKHMSRVFQQLAEEFAFNEKDLDEVRNSCSLLNDVAMDDVMAAIKQGERDKKKKKAAEAAANTHMLAALASNNNNNDKEEDDDKDHHMGDNKSTHLPFSDTGYGRGRSLSVERMKALVATHQTMLEVEESIKATSTVAGLSNNVTTRARNYSLSKGSNNGTTTTAVGGGVISHGFGSISSFAGGGSSINGGAGGAFDIVAEIDSALQETADGSTDEYETALHSPTAIYPPMHGYTPTNNPLHNSNNNSSYISNSGVNGIALTNLMNAAGSSSSGLGGSSTHGTTTTERRSRNGTHENISFSLQRSRNGSTDNNNNFTTTSNHLPPLHSASTRDRRTSNAEDLNRKLSVVGRGPAPTITAELLAYVRAIFLAMVRVRYWHDIEHGKLPRKSKSAKFLLYSVEVGLDEVHMNSSITTSASVSASNNNNNVVMKGGFRSLDLEGGGSSNSNCSGTSTVSEAEINAMAARDWVCLENKLAIVPLIISVLTVWEDYVPITWFYGYPSRYLNKLECNREERMVYMLTSFIAAHEHAQQKIHDFIKSEEEEDAMMSGGVPLLSPEEVKVIAESKQAVAEARKKLDAMNAETVAAIRTKQAAALILNKEAEMVKNMVNEGLLIPSDAEEILELISKDMLKIDKKRNQMYREHGDSSSLRRKGLRKLEELPSHGLMHSDADI